MELKHDDKQLFDEFQNTWNLEKVKNMTLEEYTGIKSSGERNDFTYWIEKKLENLGSIWGGSSFKFGVYKRDSTEAKEQYKGRAYNENYAWLEKYGSTPEKAFEKVKTLIIQVIEYSQKNELTKIDEIDLGHAYKWKIAFHYQNPDDMKMFCIFQQNTLKKIAENELSNGNLPTSQIYMKLMSDKKYTLEDSCNERSIPLWKKYNINDDSYDENSQSDINKNKGDTTKTTPPLIQILYGPPGTGKTYSTIDKALEILGYAESDNSGKVILDYTKIKQKLQNIADNNKSVGLDLENLNSKNDRELAKLLFDYYRSAEHNKEQRQIEFVTFHQSFSYEEFVEGIKPKLTDYSDSAESSKMSYTIKSGIFKEICKSALENLQNSQKSVEQVQKELNLQELFEAYLESVELKINETDFNNPALKIPNSKMTIRKIYRLDNGEGRSLFVGVEGSDSMQSLTKDIILRDYMNFKAGVIKSYQDIKPKYESQAKYHGNAIYYFELFKKNV